MEPEPIPEEQTASAAPPEEDDPNAEETSDFIDMNHAVEVQVDEDNVPMDEDDESDGEEKMEEQVPDVVDMSKQKLESHTGPVYSVACHLDHTAQNLLVLSGGGDDKAFLHRISVGANPVSHQLEHQHKDSVSAVALNLPFVSEDLKKTPRLAAAGSYDGAIIIYDPDTGKQLKTLEGPSDVEWLSFHPKGGSVLLAGSAEDGTIWMYHIPMNKCLQVFVGHESGVNAGAFSPDGRWALSASSDGTVRIWAPKTGMSKHVFRLGDAGLTCMGTNGGSDGQLIVVGGEDGQAHVCHIGTKKVVASLRHYEPPGNMQEEEEVELPMSVEAVGFAAQSVNPNWCATAGVDGVLKIWDLAKDGHCRQICKPTAPTTENAGDGANGDAPRGNGGITRLVWHPSQPLVFTTCCDGCVQVWDARNGKQLHTVTGHTDVVNDVKILFIDNDKTALIVSGSDDNSVRLFEVNIASLLESQTSFA